MQEENKKQSRETERLEEEPGAVDKLDLTDPSRGKRGTTPSPSKKGVKLS